MAFRATPSSLFFARSGSFASSIRFRSLERIKLSFPSRSASNESRSGSLLAWYSTKLDTHPLLTKGISSGLIAGAGDWLCQTGIEGGKWDYVRTGRFTFLGTFLVAPVIHVWFAFLSKAIPGVSLVAVSQRVAVDQFFFAPCFMSVRQAPSRVRGAVSTIMSESFSHTYLLGRAAILVMAVLFVGVGGGTPAVCDCATTRRLHAVRSGCQLGAVDSCTNR
jgi:hypothetical protein